MAHWLTDKDLELFANIPETDLVELAVELDMAVPEVISPGELLDQAVERIADRARQEGLPLSRYDRDDLEDLEIVQRLALARLCDFPEDIDDLIRAGEKVFKKLYRKRRPKSQVPLLLPSFLPALARFAVDRGSGSD